MRRSSLRRIRRDLSRSTYPEGFVSAPELIQTDLIPERATLEILWQQDVSATVLVRDTDGSLSARDSSSGIPAVSDRTVLGQGASGARASGSTELIGLAADPPPELELWAVLRGRRSP